MNKPINLDWNGWHIWHGAGRQKVFANGPDRETRHLEFDSPDAAINWLFVTGRKELARALHKHIKELSV